jgi:hypothetical protein
VVIIPYTRTNWVDNVTPLNAQKLNNIEDGISENKSSLSAKPTQTTADIVYYVDTANGNDSNNGLAVGAGNAFKTIAKAISMLPQIINHTVTINCASGYYNETLLLQGFNGKGSLTINGDNIQSTTRQLNSIAILQCLLSISINGFNLISQTINVITVNASLVVKLTNLKINGGLASNGFVGLYCIYGGQARISNSDISNFKYALATEIGGVMYSDTNTGSGNTYGLTSNHNGLIAKNGTQPTGTTPELRVLGGRIVGSEASSLASSGYKIYEDGFIEQWIYINVGIDGSGIISTANLSFPIAFPNAVYTVNANVYSVDGSISAIGNFICNGSAVSMSQYIVKGKNTAGAGGTSAYVCVIAKGR